MQCEKPTLTIAEGKILIETMRKLGRVFQTSTEDRSLPMYHRMAELVRNGRIGKLQKIEVILPLQPNFPGDPTPQPATDKPVVSTDKPLSFDRGRGGRSRRCRPSPARS